MNVNNSTQGNETFIWTVPVAAMKITLYSILLVWSLLGNVLVIAVVYCNQNLRTNMNYLIVNMAVSDLLVPLGAAPWIISQNATNFEWLVDGPLGEALCRLLPFFSHISPFVSSISLVIIAFQRFMAVVYPHRQQILSQTRWIAIFFPWIIAIALHSPYFYMFSLRNESCRVFVQWMFQLILFSMITVVGFAVPLIVIIIFYIIIIYKLRRSLDNVRGMMEKEMIRSRQKTNRRIFSMLITIIVLFTICWCPLTLSRVMFFVPSFQLHYEFFHNLYDAFWYMWYLLAAINACIYFVFLKDFRQGLKSLYSRRPENEPGRPRAPCGDSNQHPTCTPLHINTTSV